MGYVLHEHNSSLIMGFAVYGEQSRGCTVLNMYEYT